MIILPNRLEAVGRYRCPMCGDTIIWDWAGGYGRRLMKIENHRKDWHCEANRVKREHMIKRQEGFA